MTKTITKEKIGLVLIAAMLVTNPLSSQYLVHFIDWALVTSAQYTVWVTLVASVYIISLLGWYMWQSREKPNLKPKTKKKTPAFIET